jgi:putative flippase GtrA
VGQNATAHFSAVMQTDIARNEPNDGILHRIRTFDLTSSSFVRFLAVGGIAYVITQIALALFYDVLPLLPSKDDRTDLGLFRLETRLFLASAIAVEAAIIFKFFANERWAFAGRQRTSWIGFRLLAFNVSCLASSAATIATVNVLTPVFDLSPYIANTVGTLLGFMVNYAVSAHLIWPHHQRGASI